MKTNIFRVFHLLIIFGLLLSLGSTTARAQADPPPGVPQQDADGLWYSTSETPALASANQLLAAGGPDDYGYTWSDEPGDVTYNWIDISTTGTNTGITNSVPVSGAIDIGFDFKFYENSYNQLYVSRYGYIGFDPAHLTNSQSAMLSAEPPNNVIAPHWASFFNMLGSVRTQKFGTAPNRYFVVEWHRMTARVGWPQEYTFELILHENGDIVFQYETMPFSGTFDYYCQSSGIEDITGKDGLAITPYCTLIPPNHAVRIFRPQAAAHISIDRLVQGAFSSAGFPTEFDIKITNTGETTSPTQDTYNLSSVLSTWPVTFYAANGTTLLADSNGDTLLDTGSIAQGGSATVVARVQTPAGAVVGTANTVSATFCSSLDASKCKTVRLQASVPAPFAQVFNDGDRVYQSLIQPIGVNTKDVSPGVNPSVLELPDGSFISAWSAERCIASCSVWVNEIKYTRLSKTGATLLPVTNLTTHGSATENTTDETPVIAATPDGQIGLLWLRRLQNGPNSFNENIYFAVLNSQGSLVYGPTNLTNNNAYGDWTTPDVPNFFGVGISATSDNRFVIAWDRSHRINSCSANDCYIDDIYYAVRSSAGAAVGPVTKFTTDTTAALDGYYDPRLTPLSNDRVLLSWSRESDSRPYYAVLNSAGAVIQPAASIADPGRNYNTDAAQLSNGNILLAWTNSFEGTQIHYVVLGANYSPLTAVRSLEIPTAVPGSDYVSVTDGGFGRAVLTWLDYSWDYRGNLAYALVSSSGNVLTQPMVFHSNQNYPLLLMSNDSGFGNTTLTLDYPKTFLPMVMR